MLHCLCLAGPLRAQQHVTGCACPVLSTSRWISQWDLGSLFSYSFSCSACVCRSPHRDIRREGSVLPCSGLGSGSVILLPSHPQEHHKTDLLLQSSWESLGTKLPEMSLFWIRLVNCSWNFNWILNSFKSSWNEIMPIHEASHGATFIMLDNKLV